MTFGPLQYFFLGLSSGMLLVALLMWLRERPR